MYSVRMRKDNVMIRDHWRCRYCGAPAFNLDHVIPLQRWDAITGGSEGKHASSNLVASCAECNSFKDNMLLEEAGMDMLPEGTVNDEHAAAAIRASFMISHPRRAKHLRHMIRRGQVLTQEIRDDRRWQKLLAEAREAAQNEHNLHDGFYP